MALRSLDVTSRPPSSEPYADASQTFGALLRRFRRAAGLSQEVLAERARMSTRGVSDLERGARRIPRHETVDLLADALRLAGADRARLEATVPRGRASMPANRLDSARKPRALPAMLTSFVGRAQELAEVRDLLASARLLTLTGTPGCGKTRCALEVARQLGPRFADGVWLVELAPLSEPSLVPRAVAIALGLQEVPDQPVLATLVGALALRHVLLLLDNCEHLVEACSRLASTLLRECPRVQILATSREPLGVAGEAAYPLSPLPIPEAPRVTSLRFFGENDAVRLFVERARAAQPHFVLTEATAPAVAQVCQRLDGIPLALELAAARVRALPVEQLAARLDQRFRLLTGGNRADLPRQQTLAASIAWSYALLPSPEQELFTRLSVFTGGWTLEAAEAVCAGDGIPPDAVVELLVRLVDKSMVTSDEQPDGTARYRLLETLQQYGRELLEAHGLAAALQQRRAAWCLTLVEEAEPHLIGPGRDPWLSRLDREQDNVRAALAWSFTPGGDLAVGERIAGVLGWYWSGRGALTEGRRWLEALLAREDSSAPAITRAKMLGGAGELARAQGDYATARAHLDEAVGLVRTLEAPAWLAVGLTLLGLAVAGGGAPAEAVPIYQESLALIPHAPHRYWRGFTLQSLGTALAALGDRDAADLHYDESLALFRAVGDRWGQALVLRARGELAAKGGAAEHADALYQESAAIAEDLRDRALLGLVRCSLGRLALGQGDTSTATARFHESLALWHEIGYRPGVVLSLIGLGQAAARRGQPRRAGQLLGAADAHFVPSGLYDNVLDGTDRAALSRAVASIRTTSDLGAFDSGWHEGHATTLEQAVDRERAEGSALGRGTATRPQSGVAADTPAGLTHEELEVLRLIAGGRSNQDIAASLALGARTVERRITGLYRKIGARGKADATAFAYQHHLA